MTLEEVEEKGVELIVPVDDAQEIPRIALGEDGKDVAGDRLQEIAQLVCSV